MNGPPPLSLALGPGRRERQLSIAIWSAAGVVVGCWLQSLWGWSVGWILITALSLMGAWLGRLLAAPLRGGLSWDGHGWWLHPAEGGAPIELHSLTLCVDLGPAVILSARSGAWCLLTRRGLGAQWHGLQLALRQGRANPPLRPSEALRP